MLRRTCKVASAASYLATRQHARLYSATSGCSLARILATDGVDECCVPIFKEQGHQVDLIKTLPEEELMKIIGNYDGLVVRSATKVNANVLKAGRQLRIVGRAGVGVDNIDVKEATKQGVIVMNTPGGNTVSTAQLTLSLLCAMARSLPAADMSIKAGKWDRKMVGVEMHGKTLGVIGCGRIGQTVAATAKAMGMHVLGYDPVLSTSDFKALDIQRADLDRLFAQSDFLTVHTPLIPETANLLNDSTFAKCKKGVRIVNCARGGIVDEAALLRALESGQVASAALDVFTSEPPKDHLRPLLSHPNLICTPHLGASTEEAQVNVARDIARQMADVLAQRDFLGVVNVDYLSASCQPPMKPFVRLAETLGAMQAQFVCNEDNPVVSTTLQTFGGRDVCITSRTARRLLQAAVLKGMLPHLSSSLSRRMPDLISAPVLAQECGLEVVISEEAPEHVGSPYWNLLAVEVMRKDGSRSKITGAVFGSVPHLVKVDDYDDLFAFRPDGRYILTFRNEDRPGVISDVLAVLHRAEVNIASMNVARKGKTADESDLALCFMALDDDVPPQAMESLAALPALRGLAKMRLH